MVLGTAAGLPTAVCPSDKIDPWARCPEAALAPAIVGAAPNEPVSSAPPAARMAMLTLLVLASPGSRSLASHRPWEMNKSSDMVLHLLLLRCSCLPAGFAGRMQPHRWAPGQLTGGGMVDGGHLDGGGALSTALPTASAQAAVAFRVNQWTFEAPVVAELS